MTPNIVPRLGPFPLTGPLIVSLSIMVLSLGCGSGEVNGTGPSLVTSGTVLQGVVSDRVTNPLPGVAVDIADGPLAGATTLTDASGRYAFSEATPLPVTVRLRREGYAPKNEFIWQKLPGYWFWLSSLDAPFNFEPGNYRLRISLDPADATNWIPRAPCGGIPTEALTHQLSAAVKLSNSGERFDHFVSVSGEGMAFTTGFSVALGIHEAAVMWDSTTFIARDLGNLRYVQIEGNDYGARGALSSSGSMVSISTPLSIDYCELSGPIGSGITCRHVPSSQILDHHACNWNQAVMRFERQ